MISQIINSGFKAERSCDLEWIWPLLGVSRFMMSLLRLSVIVHHGPVWPSVSFSVESCWKCFNEEIFH